jgi:hypothetical protein
VGELSHSAGLVSCTTSVFMSRWTPLSAACNFTVAYHVAMTSCTSGHVEKTHSGTVKEKRV